MSENGKHPTRISFREAAARHRAERLAWRRVQAARRELGEALAGYSFFLEGAAPLEDLPNGLTELPESETLSAGELNGIRTDGAPQNGLTAAQRAGFDDPPADRVSLPDDSSMKPIEPAANAAIDRLGQLLDGQDPSRGLNGQQADSSLPPWTSADLEHELRHALQFRRGSSASLSDPWKLLIAEGATNERIGAALNLIWPRERFFFAPPQTGGKLGYTIQSTALPGGHYFWLGAFRGPGHKATLSGSALIHRIRTVLEIPTPTEARKKAQDSFREPTVKAEPADSQKAELTDFVPEPFQGEWDEASIKNALEDLGMLLPTQAVMCSGCKAIRPRWGKICPDCMGADFDELAPQSDLDLGNVGDPAAVDPGAKRGRGRPKGSKTRKAAAS